MQYYIKIRIRENNNIKKNTQIKMQNSIIKYNL